MATLVFQRRIQEYRIGVFEELAKVVPDLVVLTETDPPAEVKFRWQRVEVGKVFCFRVWKHDIKLHEDVVIAGLDFFNLTSVRYVFFSRLRFVLWGHGFGRSTWSFLMRPARILAAKSACASLFYTDGGARALQNWVPRERSFVARNTLALPEYRSPPDRKRDSLLFFGDLRKEKGVDVLIEAFKIVAPRNAELRLVIVGDGLERDRLVSTAERSGFAHRIFFFPRTKRPEELKPFLDVAIATVSPRHVGLSVVQSFWAGVPVVTCCSRRHAPEVEYCLDGVNSIFFRGGAKELGDALTYVLNPVVAESLAEGARRFYINELGLVNMLDGFKKAIASCRGESS